VEEGFQKLHILKMKRKLFYLHTHILFSPRVTALGARPMWRNFPPHVDIASKLKQEGPHHE
jgi:hypothetical protein